MCSHHLTRKETRQTGRAVQDEHQAQLEPEGGWRVEDREAEMRRDVWRLLYETKVKRTEEEDRTRVFYPTPNSTLLGE